MKAYPVVITDDEYCAVHKAYLIIEYINRTGELVPSHVIKKMKIDHDAIHSLVGKYGKEYRRQRDGGWLTHFIHRLKGGFNT